MKYQIFWSFELHGDYVSLGVYQCSSKYDAAALGARLVDNHLAFIKVEHVDI